MTKLLFTRSKAEVRQLLKCCQRAYGKAGYVKDDDFWQWYKELLEQPFQYVDECGNPITADQATEMRDWWTSIAKAMLDQAVADDDDVRAVPPPQIAGRLWLTPEEAAAVMPCSLSLVYELLDSGELDGYKVGRRKYVYPHSVESYKARHALQKSKADEVPPEPHRPTRSRLRQAPTKPFRHLS